MHISLESVQKLVENDKNAQKFTSRVAASQSVSSINSSLQQFQITTINVNNKSKNFLKTIQTTLPHRLSIGYMQALPSMLPQTRLPFLHQSALRYFFSFFRPKLFGLFNVFFFVIAT
jgi:hypothetical protein